MSAADASVASIVVRQPRTTLSPRFLLSELRLMFGRRRNQAGLAALAALPIFISIAVKTTLSQPGPGAPDFFRSITGNGLFVARADGETAA